jgi:hypothetical protein
VKNKSFINVSEIEEIFKDDCITNEIEFLGEKFDDFLKFLETDIYDWVKGNLRYFHD